MAGTAVECVLPGGPTVRGERWGDGPSRIILLHDPGEGVDIDGWHGLPRVLSRVLPVTAVAFDLPGHGLSDDPWDPARLPDLVRALAAPTGPGERTFMIAAGASALAALRLAEALALSGLVGFSSVKVDNAATPFDRSPKVPKLLIAGSRADDDLEAARYLAQSSGGWCVVSSLPVNARGTGLLATEWGVRVREEVYGFLRDCLRRRPAYA